MKLKNIILVFLLLVSMIVFFVVKTSVLIEYIPSTSVTRATEYVCFLSFIPILYLLFKDYVNTNKEGKRVSKYTKKLNQVLISQNNNPLFYTGNVNEGAKVLTKQVTESTCSDRCSIWLYNEDKTSIICDKLYIRAEDKWYEDIELFKKDFSPYFEALISNPIIVAHNAETHPATSCFTEGYLKPLGVKSMLDVPITFKGETIGVICIESLTQRKWIDVEVNFASLLSSLYTFSYSVNETNKLANVMDDFEKFVDTSVLFSKTDKMGRITYVNHKFSEVSGWGLDEAIGKDHSIVNSGLQPDGYWGKMYETVMRGEIWNDIVCNKAKDGSHYWVDTYIRARFDDNGKLLGFSSIRQDVTKIMDQSVELDRKNTYLEHAAKILRHDMHSGINTYIPRGLSSLERRITHEDIVNLKIEAPLKMIKEGLKHSQKVYRGVYEFTNLVKKDVVLNKEELNIKDILSDYLSSTAYVSQVVLDDNLPTIEVNEPLFCTATDNLIRNGLKYNDSDTKFVKIYSEGDFICIQDNGRGITQEDFEHLSKPYVRKEGQKESGSGLGLNICVAILKEHGFEITCEKNEIGTKMKIKVK